MFFANPWGLLGLISVPTILAIHMYHRRFPPVLVGGLHLWGAEVRIPTSGRKRERLPMSISLLLELLAAIVLTLVLSQPRLGDQDRVRHFVIVLDNSASMGAVNRDEKSNRQKALDEITRRVENSARGSVVTIILTGHRPEMLIGPAVKWDEAEKALANWHPALPGHEPLSALDMAAQLAEDGGDLIYVTDSMPTAGQRIPKNADVVAVGSSLPNVAFTAARWMVDPNTLAGSLFLRIANIGPRSVQVRVSAIIGESSAPNTAQEPAQTTPTAQSVLNQLIEIPADGERSLEAQLPGGLSRLRVSLKSDDDPLAIDNSIELVEPKIRIVHVANTLAADHAANVALARILEAIPDVSIAAVDEADLVIAPGGILPESARELWWFGVGPLDDAEAAKKDAKDLLGPFLVEKRHPLVEGVLLDGVVWGGVQPLELSVTPLVSAGAQTLLARLNGTLTTAFVLNIDIARSNLLDSPDWPILLSNLLELRRDALPGLRRWNYRMNESIQFRLYEGTTAPEEFVGSSVVLDHAGSRRELAPSSVVEIPSITEAGQYRISVAGKPFGEFAVNFFDGEESNLLGLRSGHRPPIVEDVDQGYTVDNPLTWLMLLALLLLLSLVLGNWYVLKPKPNN
jgi:Ca-activated chloride channel homolog